MAPANLIDGGPSPGNCRASWLSASRPSRHPVSDRDSLRARGRGPCFEGLCRRKEKTCAELGIFSETHVLPEATSQAVLLETTGALE